MPKKFDLSEIINLQSNSKKNNMFRYNQETKFACITYKDKHSAERSALNDLNISYNNNIFAAGLKRLKGFKEGDYVMICADDRRKKFGFLAQIVEKLDTILTVWADQGGDIWEFNFAIQSISPIMDLSSQSTIRTQMKEIGTHLGLNSNNMFNMRFCSEKLLPLLQKTINQGLFQ